MSEPETIKSAIETAASNPKIATMIATSTASTGAAVQLEWLQGILSLTTMTIGAITTLVVLAIQLIKLARNYRAWQRDEADPDDQP